MNIAAYCRVSTDKADQLNSLVAQKDFFYEYTKRTGDTLIRLYADEGRGREAGKAHGQDRQSARQEDDGGDLRYESASWLRHRQRP